MRERITLLLILCILGGTCAPAQPLARILETDPLGAVLEQQPLVKCLSVFSDISLRLVNTWFLHCQSQKQPSPKPAKRHSPLSRDLIILSVETGKSLKALRALAVPAAAAIVNRLPVLDRIDARARSERYRPGHCVLFVLLLLLTLLPRADLSDAVIIFSYASVRPVLRKDRVFCLRPSPHPSPASQAREDKRCSTLACLRERVP